MSALATRALHRELLLARIADNRVAIGASLQQLARPVRSLARWQDGLARLTPLLPGVVVIGVLAWLLLRLIRGHEAESQPSRRRSWLVLLRQALGALQLAMQCQALLQAARPGAAIPGSMPARSLGEQMR